MVRGEVPDDDRVVAALDEVGDGVAVEPPAEAGADPVGVEVEAVHLPRAGRQVGVRAGPGAGEPAHGAGRSITHTRSAAGRPAR